MNGDVEAMMPGASNIMARWLFVGLVRWIGHNVLDAFGVKVPADLGHALTVNRGACRGKQGDFWLCVFHQYHLLSLVG
jgi:hypothetical protein